MPSGPSCSATTPAAAMTPAWRIPPPTILRARLARAMNAASPTTTEPTGQPRLFDRQNVAEAPGGHEVPRRHAECDRGVEQPGAVDEQRHADLARHVRHGRHVGRRQRLAHRQRMAVLDGQHRGDRLVDVVRVADRRADSRQVHRAVVSPRDHPDRRSGDDRVPGALAAERVDIGRADDLATARDVGHEPDEVAHRAARDEQSRLGARAARRIVPRAPGRSGPRRTRHRRPRPRPSRDASPGRGA